MTELTERIDAFEIRLRSMENELYELRRLARAAQPRVAPPVSDTVFVSDTFVASPTPPPKPPQPKDVFVAQSHPGSGAPAVLSVVAAAVVIAWRTPLLRSALAWISGALGLYAATLAILEASEDLGGSVHSAFQRGHTAVSFLWGVVGLTLLVVGLKRGRRHPQFGGFALYGLALVKLFLYDLSFLNSIARAFSFLAVGALLVVGGFFYQRLTLDSRT